MNILAGLDTSTIIILVVVGVVVLLIVSIIGWWIKTSNTFKKMKISIEDSLSGIDIALTKRFDLLTEQLKVVKGYMKHEKEILLLVTEMRTKTNSNSKKDLKEIQEMSDTIKKVGREVNLTYERYPDLKADRSVVVLQASVTDAEEHLQAARRLYNSNVSAYNKSIVVFPRSIVAKHCNVEKCEFFAADPEKTGDVPLEF